MNSVSGSASGRQPEGHRAGRVAGRVVDDQARCPARSSVRPSASSSTSSGSVKVSPPKSCWPGAEAQPAGRVGQQRAVVGVDVGRDAPGAADRRHRPDVVDVAVRRQHRGRPQPVSLDNFLDALLSVLSRVDNQALLAWSGRQQIAVGRERASGEPGYQHCAATPLGAPGGARPRALPGPSARRGCLQATENCWSAGRWPVVLGSSGHELGAVGTRKVTAALPLPSQRYDSRSFAVRCPGPAGPAADVARPGRPQDTADEQEDRTGGHEEGTPAQARQGRSPAPAWSARLERARRAQAVGRQRDRGCDRRGRRSASAGPRSPASSARARPTAAAASRDGQSRQRRRRPRRPPRRRRAAPPPWWTASASTPPSGTAARKVSLPPATPDTKATYMATIVTNRGDHRDRPAEQRRHRARSARSSRWPARSTSTTPPATGSRTTRHLRAAVRRPDRDRHRRPRLRVRHREPEPAPTYPGRPRPGDGQRWPAAAATATAASSSLSTRTLTCQPSYTPFGTVVSGLNIIQNVAKAGTHELQRSRRRGTQRRRSRSKA